MSVRERQFSRRTVLRTAGSAAVVVGGTSLVGTTTADSEWVVAETPTDQPLYDATHTADGPYAVGGEGHVLRRGDDGWEVVVDSGPGARNRSLYAADVTDDGRRLWFAGDSGAVGAYDVDEDRKHDFSYPAGLDDDLLGLVVDGDRGEECVLVGSSAGDAVDGCTGADGEFAWNDPVEPADGAAVAGFALEDGDTLETAPPVVGADQSQNAYRSPDFNESWDRFGVEDADETFYGVETLPDRVFVPTDAGTVYRYDRAEEVWTPEVVAETAVTGLDDSPDGETLLASGEEGRVHERTVEDEWTTRETPAMVTLRGVSYAEGLGFLSDPVDVAVGEAGTVVERAAGN